MDVVGLHPVGDLVEIPFLAILEMNVSVGEPGLVRFFGQNVHAHQGDRTTERQRLDAGDEGPGLIHLPSFNLWKVRKLSFPKAIPVHRDLAVEDLRDAVGLFGC
jgi:hypothetical protein